MEDAKRRRLRAAGWQAGEAEEFLGLSEQEVGMIRIHESLAAAVRSARIGAGLTQHDLARRLGSSQSRVAKIEAADPGVSLDLMVRASLALGRSVAEVGEVVARAAGSRRKPAGGRTRRARTARGS